MNMKQIISIVVLLVISTTNYAEHHTSKMIQIKDPTFSGLLNSFSCRTEFQTFCNSDKECRALNKMEGLGLDVDLVHKTLWFAQKDNSQAIIKESAHTWAENSNERLLDIYTKSNNHANFYIDGKPNSKWIINFSYSEPATDSEDTNVVWFGKCEIK